MLDFNEIQLGEKAEIIGFNPGEKTYRRKLLSMGLIRGTVFRLSKIAPLGDPVEIEVRGFKLLLRKNETVLLKTRKVS